MHLGLRSSFAYHGFPYRCIILTKLASEQSAVSHIVNIVCMQGKAKCTVVVNFMLAAIQDALERARKASLVHGFRVSSAVPLGVCIDTCS